MDIHASFLLLNGIRYHLSVDIHTHTCINVPTDDVPLEAWRGMKTASEKGGARNLMRNSLIARSSVPLRSGKSLSPEILSTSVVFVVSGCLSR